MKVKTSALTPKQLDWMVGVAEGLEMSAYGVDPSFKARMPGQGVIAPWRPTYYAGQAHPIIEREKISTRVNVSGGAWVAFLDFGGSSVSGAKARQRGDTALIAAMRCYCCSKLGEEVEVPDGLTR